MNSCVFSSMHTHTTFCDGIDDIETMCRAAFEKKLCAIGFSAHAPITKRTGIKSEWHLSDDRLDEYVQEVQAAKYRWKGKLAVFLGLEVDYIKGLRSAIDSDIIEINPDYLIGSVHYIVPANGAQPFTVDGPPEEFANGLNEGFDGDAQALMHSYYDAMAEMITIGGFDILGHADIIKKNSMGKNLWPQESEACRQREIAYLIADNATREAGITVEVNTGGINRGKTNDVYPSVSFLRLLRECDVPAIITSDAHCVHDVDGNYDKALQALFNAGYGEHMLFSGKSGEKSHWQSEKIICRKKVFFYGLTY